MEGHIKPIHYELSFEPNFTNFTFKGTAKIDVQISRLTDTIVMNAAELKIQNAKVITDDSKDVNDDTGSSYKAKATLNKKKEELKLKLPKKISGRNTLYIEFQGILNNRLLGFYRSEYQDNKGKKRFMATTQFEAADARKAFPCWDEPVAKATFGISMTIPKDMQAISNMPLTRTKRSSSVRGKKEVEFQKTPPMSTYLVYLGVGHFDFLSSKTGNTLVRVATTKGRKNQGKLALELTKKFLNYFEKYFKIKYPLPKLDIIAVPDFAAGAMENWGAITFREIILLYDPKFTSTEIKQRIAEVIAHELAHQWFGNLVTMKWWNDLWLNESFATFMATKAVASLYPSWDFWDQFIKEETIGGMNLDSLKSSHPVDVPVKNPSEIREIFDAISYNKGGSLLMMLEDFVGENTFQRGLQQYLRQHQYQNATTQDLWDALAAASKKPIRNMMDSWIKKTGYPVVEVSQANNTKTRSKITYQFSQTRFLLDDTKSSSSKDKDRKWLIPLSIRTSGNYVYKELMKNKSKKITVSKSKTKTATSKNWIKVNSGQKGFYRVAYQDEETLDGIMQMVKEKKLGNRDRWGIQNDLFAFCLSGRVPLLKYIEFAKNSYTEEEDYLVASELVSHMNFLNLVFFNEEIVRLLKLQWKDFLNRLLDKLSWDQKKGEKQTRRLLRNQVIHSLGMMGEERVLEESKKRFNAYLQRPSLLDPDLRRVVFSLIAWQSNDERMFYKFISMYRKATMHEEKIRHLSAIASFNDKKLVQKALDFALSNEVKSQDLYVPILRASVNPAARELVWPWIKRNWKKIVSKFGAGSPLLNRVIGAIAYSTFDQNNTDEIRKFFKTHPAPGTEMKQSQTLEQIRIYSRFVSNSKKEFLQN